MFHVEHRYIGLIINYLSDSKPFLMFGANPFFRKLQEFLDYPACIKHPNKLNYIP